MKIMKQLVVVIITGLVLIGCSDPEAEANKLFTKASLLLKEADEINLPDYNDGKSENALLAFEKRNNALKLIYKIQLDLPSSSIAVQISSGAFLINGLAIEQIKKKMIPNANIRIAAKNGDITVLKQYFAGGWDIEYKNYKDQSLLWLAAARGQLKTVEYLISIGADVNAYSIHALTPLDVSTNAKNENASKEVAELLQMNGGKTCNELGITTENIKVKKALEQANQALDKLNK